MDAASIEKNRGLFATYFGDGGEMRRFFSPGRVNIIGEHLDYNGGFVFPAALTIGIHAFVRFNGSDRVRMRSTNFKDEFALSMKSEIKNDGSGGWGNYPAGVIKHLIDEGKKLRGADVLFASTLPEGAGLSSSACIEVLTAYIMDGGNVNEDRDRVRIALLCKDVENRFIGVQCGIMDQFAVAMGKKDHAILLNADTLAYDRIPFMLSSHKLLIMNTNKPRKLSDSKYNERRSECERALAEIRKSRNIAALAEASPDEVESLSDSVLRKRARHVVTENARVRRSVEVLQKNDIVSFGRLMTESHSSLRDDYEVTGVELDSLVAASLDVKECIGARMTGAGFGGCAIALVGNGALDAFREKVGDRYRKATGLAADFYETEIDDGVREIR